DNDDLRAALGLEDERDLPDGSRQKRQFYSPAEMRAAEAKLFDQLSRLEGVPEDKKDTFQKQLEQLGRRYNIYRKLAGLGTFYVVAFILVAVSWLLATGKAGGGWGRPLARGAVAVVGVSLLVHTFGILSRMYISGRPPVTNLYSSAVFIGFGAALLGLVLERI